MTVDIIIATLNEEKRIGFCLESILELSYPKNLLSIIIVDGESDDKTPEIVQQKLKNKISFKILTNKKKIQSAAWNKGVKNSKSEIITIISAHSLMPKDYIKDMVDVMSKTKAALVGGHMVAKGEGYIGKTIELIHHSKFGVGVGKFHNLEYEGFVDTVYGLNFSRKTFSKVGGFNEKLVRNQDVEFCSRVKKFGGKIYLAKSLALVYYNRSSLSAFIKQNYGNGYYAFITKFITKSSLSVRHFVPFLFVIFLSITVFFKFYEVMIYKYEIVNLFSYPILYLYFILNFYFSLKNSEKLGFKYFLSLFFLTPILHISYGLGTIFGVFKIFEELID